MLGVLQASTPQKAEKLLIRESKPMEIKKSSRFKIFLNDANSLMGDVNPNITS